MEYQINATVHCGPNGGMQYRLWKRDGIFVLVSKYKALLFMSQEEKDKGIAMESKMKSDKEARNSNESAWRGIMRGG
jgi:hypothetical protein